MRDLIKKYDSIFNEIMGLEKLLWKVPTYNFIKRNEIKQKIKLLIPSKPEQSLSKGIKTAITEHL